MAATLHRLIRPVVLATIAGVIVVPPLRAQCPASTLPCEPFTTTLASYQQFCANPGVGGSGDLAFDLVAGTFYCGASGYAHPGSGGFTARDRYTMAGVAPGTPATVVARLRLRGNSPYGCTSDFYTIPSGSLAATLTCGAATAQVEASSILSYSGGLYCTSGGSLDTDLLLPIACVAGQPFELAIELSTSASRGTSGMTGTLTFDGLPDGATITSCQGFTQGGPVATRATSWGKLKAIYR